MSSSHWSAIPSLGDLQLTGRRVHATGRHPRRLAAVAGCQLRSRAPRPEPAHSPAEAADSTGLKQKQQHRWTRFSGERRKKQAESTQDAFAFPKQAERGHISRADKACQEARQTLPTHRPCREVAQRKKELSNRLCPEKLKQKRRKREKGRK